MTTIFAKIIQKEIPSYIIYEDELVIAFLDIIQTTKGHTLVVTKKAYVQINELPTNILTHLFCVVQKISKVLMKTFQAQGITLLNNNGIMAGQTVLHFHIHLIPRFDQNEIFISFIDHSSKLKKNDYQNIQKQIIAHF